MPLVPPYIAELEPYKAGKPISEVQRELGIVNVIKLASNENPMGASPLALEEMKKVMTNLHYYPEGGRELREVLAEKFHLKVSNVIVGSGSESLMANIIRTFLCDDDEMLTTEAPFIGFRVLAQSRGVKTTFIPYNEWRYDLKEIAKRITERTKIIYLANPNNPTGTIFTKDEFDEFMLHVPLHTLIIHDEAYFEYAQDAEDYPDSMHYRYDNVITLRTFSKCYGLAGVRVGYGFAHDELITNLMKVKLPFEPSSLAVAAGIGALRDVEFLERTLEVNRIGLQYLTSSLLALGFTVVPSYANFIMLVFAGERDANAFYLSLLHQGVIVRPLKAFGLSNCVRITIGTEQENLRLMESVEKIYSKKLVEQYGE